VNCSSLSLLLIGWLVVNLASSAIAGDTTNPAFAVVELFSSEGCSSCPPADKVLAELAAAAKANGRRIFPLEFHVDYWNYLGWQDPFSLPFAAERQRQYASARRNADIYTPQMIVNGTEEFAGSDRTRAWKAVDSALARPVHTEITMHASRGSAGWLVEYQVKGVSHGCVIGVAVVESGLVSQVRRGENAGATLTHANVVRDFTSQPIGDTGDGRVTLKPPTRGSSKNLQLIAFVQDAHTLAMLGATSLELPPSSESMPTD
jgi:hypothetical protein